jgi:hypothetical protein
MVAVVLMSVLAVAGLCILADRLAAYPLPFTLGANAAQFAYQALVFAAPAAVAGYALVHGVTKEAVPSEIWPQIFCISGGALVGVSASLRLAGGMGQPTR